MSYIPDCRNDENYNQKYLEENDAEFVAGFDWCRINAVNIFFDNLDVYQDELTLDKGNGEKLSLADLLEENDEFKEEVRGAIMHWIEMERDELITSMIDNMGEDFDARKAEVDAGKAQNCLSSYEFEIEDAENWQD